VIGSRARVVVADDVAEIRQIVTLMLEGTGRFVVVGQGSDGAEAAAEAERLQPDLVVLDADMPNVSGPQAVPLVRTAAPRAAVVILSGTRPATADHGADLWLEKGISPSELGDALTTLLADRAPAPAPIPSGPRSIVQTLDPGAFLAAIVESSNDVIIGKTLEGVITSWNAAAERLYGYSAQEAVGQSISMLVPPERPDEVPAILRRISSGQPVQNYETVRVRKDGSRLEVALTISPVRDGSGTIIGASTIARDIGTRRQSDAALARAVAQLERQNHDLVRSNEELDAFAYVVSHDLAQPLQVVFGYLELLSTQYGEAMEPRAREWVEVALRNVDRTRSLVREVLTYARAGSAGGAREPVDLQELVGVVLEGLSAAVAESGGRVDIEGELPLVIGDASQLGQVLQNLISNGLKFRRPDVRPVVCISSPRRTEETVELVVADNGIGIAREHRDRVFEMFQRVGDRNAYAGTGVGLAIVRKVVERHGGRIWVDEAEGGGSAFHVVLPAGDLVTD
jgi:PAS domain S-box-containing protein